MAFPLTLLPSEIVSYHLLGFLGLEDILNLGKCIDFEVPESVYKRLFPDGTYLDRYNSRVFHERVAARLYLLGDLFKLSSRLPSGCEYVDIGNCGLPRTNVPLKVESGDRAIVNVDIRSFGWPTIRDSRGVSIFVWVSCLMTVPRQDNHSRVKVSDELKLVELEAQRTAQIIRKFASQDGSEQLKTRNAAIMRELSNVNKFGRFVQTREADGGSDPVGLSSLLALTEFGEVISVSILHINETAYTIEAHAIQGLEGVKVVSVAAGSSHFLALSAEGDVYTWGRERDFCGCLGLGRLRDARRLKNVRQEGTSLIVDRPTKINLPGKVYAIFAQGDRSGMLIYKD